jgi:Spy/CpxP family protein refolding chaperone
MKVTRISLIAALIAGVLVSYTPPATAQDAKESKPAPKREAPPGGPGGQRAEAAKERLHKIAEELKLTDEQKTKVEAVLKEQQEKMRGVRGGTSTREERMEKVKVAQEETNKKMKEILTPEQFAKWEKMPQARGPGGGGRPGAPSGDKKPVDPKASDTKGQ